MSGENDIEVSTMNVSEIRENMCQPPPHCVKHRSSRNSTVSCVSCIQEIYVMLLFPNCLQLYDKLHDAEDCPNHHCTDARIMLEEFCIFATELARLCERGTAVPMNASRSLHGDGKDTNHKSGSKRMAYEVFLGGSCNPTTWRSDIAIPTLQNLGITYYNPQVSQWGPELIAQEYEAKQTARVLLFVIDNQTRNSAGIIEAAQLAATRSESLVLVIYPYRQGQTILGEAVSMQEYYDLMNGLLVLQYLMERQRIPIFESVSVALHCTSKMLREEINVQDCTGSHTEDGIKPIRISLTQNGTDAVTLREIFKSMDVNDSGTVKLGEAWVMLQSNAMCNVSLPELLNTVNKSETCRSLIDGFPAKGDPTELRINFEQFSALASESSWTRAKSNGVTCENWTNSFVQQEPEKRDIYIGVVSRDLFWLESSAVPLLESMRLSLYRPSLNEYNVRLLPQELQKMKNSRLILLIVPQHSRGIAIMALAAHLIGLRAKLVLCVQTLPEGTVVSGEQDDEPPEITYCVVEHTGTLTLQAMTPTLPMPAEEELNKMFLELVDELDLTQTNRQAVLALPANKKWQIYCSRKGNGTLDNGGLRTTDLSGDPEDYINRLKTIASSPFPEEGEEVSNQMRQVEALKTALRTQPHSFVLRFIELDGLNALLQVLGTMDAEAANSNLHTSVIGCLKALMNNSNGRAHVLAHPTAINTISQSLATENIKTKISVLEILGAVCLVPGGHRKVLEAMLHFQQYHSERTRFQCIINDLDKNFGIYKDNLSLKTAIMSFINAVLNYGPGQVTLEFRLHLRYELLMLGIQPIIEKLRKYENETLDRHLDFFEMVRNEDEKELARKFEKEHVDTKSATAMFDLLRRKLSHTAAYPHLLSLLEHCLLLPLDYGSHPQHWLLFDRIVQQIVLQSENNETGSIRNPDVAPIEINVKEIIHLLAKEEELVAARKKAEELERENSDMSTRLAKKEQELDLRTQEKEDMEASLARIKERLEKETSMHIETKQRISELQDNLEMLSRQINNEKSERKRLEQLVASGSLPDDAKATLKIVEDEVLEKVETKPTPPPPPPPPLAPPPPPCMMPAAPPPMKMEIIKNVPQPSNPLKSFNWSKIPEQKLQGTIWSELDDTKLYNIMDLESIDKIFCAYQKNGVSTEGSIEDLRTLGKNKKTMSVIDSRRAQNCTILLSKLKMTDNEITRTILSMDQQNILHIDMVEQLLKYIPSSEEAALLDMHQKDLQNRADCFLYQISKVPHYEQRLRSLHYKKKFAASIAELTPRMRAVLEASRQVARSRRLRKLLELVLALGNYVNRGNARGNACGFRLASLNRLVDTKSSCSKGTTLLHYLVQILEARFREVLEIEEDMPHVRTAARVSMADLQKEVANLKNGLQDVQREIEFHRGQAQVLQGDMFLPAMRDFQAQATCRLAEAEDLFQDMKTRFDRAVRLFGEDSAGVQPDEFFGIFENFLQALAEARQDVENMRKKVEEEERRAKQEQELRKRTMERKNSREGILNSISLSKKNEANGNGQSDNKGEFDDLISALRTGDVFGEDIAKFKRSKRRPVTPSGQESRRHSTHREDSRERH